MSHTRLLAFLISGIGVGLCASAFVLVTDRLATPERKAAFEEAIADPDALGLEEREADALRAAVMMRDTLGGGIFFASPVDLSALLPETPDGWTTADYAAVDGTFITGETVTEDLFGISDRQEVLRGLSNSSQTALDVARTFRRDDRMVVIWLYGKLDTFRQLKSWEGEAREDILALRSPEGPYFAHIDGIALRQRGGVEIAQQRLSGFRHFYLDFGKVIRTEILTNASNHDLATLLASFDASDLQTVLPQSTAGYDRGRGFVFADGVFPDETPPMPSAIRLAKAARNFDHLGEIERRLLKGIANGDLASAEAVRSSPLWTDELAEPLQTIVALLP